MSNGINDILKQIYEAFQAKDFKTARKLLDQAKTIDPSNPYIARYEEQYQKLAGANQPTSSVSGEKSKKTIKIKFKGQSIDCPSCGSNLSLNKHNKASFLAFKKGETDKMKFKCTYCSHEFEWVPQKLKNLFLDFYVGKEIEITGIKYKVSGGVTYEGRWQEGYSKGDLIYNERILTDEKGNLNYLSESEAFWQEGGESGVERETEMSLKYIPDFDIAEVTDTVIKTSKGNLPVSEISEVKVSALLGENTKSYEIGEKVKLLYFKYAGAKYVIEAESAGTQKELGIYKIEFVKISDLAGGGSVVTGDIIDNPKNKINMIVGMIVGFIIFVNILGIWVLPIFILLLVLFAGMKSEKFKYAASVIVSFFIPFLIMYNRYFGAKPVTSDKFINADSYKDVKGIYRVKIKDTSDQIQYIASTKKYDYGGVRTYYKTTDGFYFSIQNQQDLDLLKEVLATEGGGIKLIDNKFFFGSNKLKNMISKGTESIK